MSAVDVVPELDQRLSGDLSALSDFARELSRLGGELPQRIDVDQARADQGLAKLVLTLIELVRRLLEKQAIRRIEAGSLSDEQIERMGETFMKLDEKMADLKTAFGLRDEDLNLNLGPLGDLL